MSFDDLARRSGEAARRVGRETDPPDISAVATRRGRRRTAVWGAAGVAALVGAVAIAASLGSGEGPASPAGPATTQPPAPTTVATTTTAADGTTTTAQPATVAPAPPGPGGEIVITGEDLDLQGSSLNPLLQSFNLDAWNLGRLVWAGATRVDQATGELEPMLLTEIPADADGTSIVLRIRDEAVWEDGVPVTAADFIFTQQLIEDPDLDISDEIGSVHAIVTGIEQGADPKEVVVSLDRPDFRFAYLFPVVVPSHVVSAAGFADDWNDDFWLSAGPFVYQGKGPADGGATEYVFARNPRSWYADQVTGDALPYLDRVRFVLFPPSDPEQRPSVRLLERGKADVHLAIPERDLVAMVFDPSPGVRTTDVPPVVWEHMDFQFGDTRFDVNPPSLVGDLRFRRAVAHAVDRGAIEGPGIGGPVPSIVETHLPGESNDVWEELNPFHPELAEALIAEVAEASQIATPSLVYTTSSADITEEIAAQVVDQLRSVGIEATTSFTGDFFQAALPERRWELAAWRWIAGRGELDLLRLLSFYDPRRDVDANWGSWAGEAADRFAETLDAAVATYDRAARIELWKQAEAILAEDVVTIPLVYRGIPIVVPYDTARVAGVAPTHLAGGSTWDIERWYRVDR